MSEQLVLISDKEPSVRIRGLNRLADEYFGRCMVVPKLVEDKVIEVLRSDPSLEVRRLALSRISADFEWWGDSPIGPVNLGFLDKILMVLPSALGDEASEGLVRSVAEIIGRLGGLREHAKIPAPIQELKAFKAALLDGLARRELDSQSEQLLQLFVQESDGIFRREALELLEAK